MFKRKLFKPALIKHTLSKHALPIILSVAMVFQSMPATALAAEEAPSSVETTAEAADETTDGEAVNPVSGDSDQQPEAPQAEDQQQNETPEPPANSEGANEPSSNAPASSEDSNESNEAAPEAPSTPDETPAPEEGQEEVIAEEVQEVNADAAATAAQIVIDENALEDALTRGLRYTDGVVTATYEPDKNPFDSLVNDTLKVNNSVISVKVGDEPNPHLNQQLTFQWGKIGTEAGSTVIAKLSDGETPQEAGEYILTISFAGVEGLCQGATDVNINFAIKQVELKIDFESVKNPQVDTTIADFKKDFKENYVLRKVKDDTELNKETYVKTINIAVKDSVSGVEITDESAKFEKGKSYSYTVSIELTDSNYTVKDIGVQDIKFQGVVPTKMEVTLLKNLEYTYGDEIKLPVSGTDYTVKVSATENGKDTELEVPAGAITATWLDADGNEIETYDKEGKELKVSFDAGTYYVLLTYTDAAGRYTECDNKFDEKGNTTDTAADKTSIRVNVNPVSIYIKPSLAKTEYVDAKTAADILQDVDYGLMKSKDNTPLTPSEFDKETGWGVSYNNFTDYDDEGNLVDSEKTQYYEPVFKLEKTELKLNEAGKLEKDDAGNPIYGAYDEDEEFVPNVYVPVRKNEKLVASSEQVEQVQKVKYRIVFSGQKAVYAGNGKEYAATDINDGANSAVPNYKVDVSKETLEKNVVPITITATNAVIDVSAYTDAERTKIFDYEPVYAERADYKKAKVDGSTEGLSYEWYDTYEEPVETDDDGNVTKTKPVKTGEPQFEFNYRWTDGQEYHQTKSNSPVEAGTYILLISYKDSKHEKAAADVELIYEITPQKVAADVAVGEGESTLTAYSDTKIDEFVTKLLKDETFTSTVKKADNNDLTKPLVEDKLLSLWEYEVEYELPYTVERQDNITKEWKLVDVDSTTPFLEGGHYRISFGVDIQWCEYLEDNEDFFQKNYQSYDEVEGQKQYYPSKYIDVTVKPMGTTPIELVIDKSQIGTTTKKYDGTPFAVPEAAVKVYNKTTGDEIEIKDIKLSYEWSGQTTKNGEAVNGGKYTLKVSFAGDENYAPCSEETVGEFEITPREITIAPILLSKIEAGSSSNSIGKIVQTDYYNEDGDWYDNAFLDINGDVLETEAISEWHAFKYGPYYDEDYDAFVDGYEAVADSGLEVVRADGVKDTEYVLKADNDYYVVPNVTLREPYNRNYKVTPVKAPFTPVRVSAVVSKSSYSSIPETSLKDFKGTDETDSKVITHKITPREGIPYVTAKNSPIKDAKAKEIGGNFFVFQIQAPKEFFKNGNTSSRQNMTESFNPIFEYEIKNIEGVDSYLLTTEETAKTNGYITVAFRADSRKADELPFFTVRWSDGYTEKFTVDFTGAVLEDDLTKAVAPKSLAFNAPAKKMVVGEKQQLDVKITKAKLDDIILLRYETDNPSVLSVSETGAVVALDKGSATVWAIPCYVDENGVKQDIQGAKTASAKISVVDVTAPKIKAVTALDTTADVTYPQLTDGYRREIYVLENPKAKESDFTAAIDKLKNGDWKNAGFAIAPVYTSTEYDANLKISKVRLNGLTANTQYTVYVRNVSGVRKLADGGSVAASAKGAVKSFKTTTSQVQRLLIEFDKSYLEEYAYRDRYNGIEQEWQYGRYVVDVSEKKLPAMTIGAFLENAKDTNAAQADLKEYILPFNKRAEELQYYAQPKLSYYALSGYYDLDDEDAGSVEPDYYNTVKIGKRYYHPSSIAKVDKKGNVTLTGKGWVHIYVYDAVTENWGVQALYISAKASKMTVAKKAAISVGESLHLEDYVTYYAGNQKLTNYNSNLRITKIEGDVDSFDFANSKGDAYDYIRYIVANEPKKSITVEVTDIGMTENNTGIITITSKDIQAVKNLKVSEVVDKYATVSFTYPWDYATYEWEQDTSEADETINQLYFRIQIRDAAKNVVSDKYYRYDSMSDYDYDGKKKTLTLTQYIGLDGDKPLNRKSSYTVSVTATYRKNEATSKPASKTFKTTDIPAAYQYEYDGSFYEYSTKADSNYKSADGGIRIGINSRSTALSNYPVLTSNNTYTLVAYPDNTAAKNRLSDTLVWKSTNTKVATVKANAGSYTAVLKTLKKGTTKLELTSKLTKRIIARWTVIVNAAGEAKYYFGDWEPDYGYNGDSKDYGDIEILTLDNPVRAKLAAGEGKIAKFVAPEYGSYTFKSTNSSIQFWYPDDESDDNDDDYYYGSSKSVSLKKGEVRYIKVLNTASNGKDQIVTITAGGTIYDTWTGAGEYTAKSKKIAFTAKEDNYYTVKDSAGKTVWQKGMKANVTEIIPDLNTGEKYTVSKRDIKKSFNKTLSDEEITSDTVNWYKFIADDDMVYTFEASKSQSVKITVYDDITSEDAISGTTVSLEKGEVRYISVQSTTGETVTTDITAKTEAESGKAITTDGTETITTAQTEDANKGIYVRYKIPEEGVYRFKTTGTAVNAGTQQAEPVQGLTVERRTAIQLSGGTAVQSSGGTDMTPDYEGSFEKDELVYVYVSSPKANTTVTIKVAKITASEIKEGANKATLSRDNSYYKFTAASDGEYTFKVDAKPRTGESAGTPSVTVNGYKGNKDFGIAGFESSDFSWTDNSTTQTLKNGDIVYLQVKTDAAEGETDEATITVSKLTAETFTETKEVSLADKEVKWLQFKASKDTIYNITCTDKRTADGKGAVEVTTASKLSELPENGSKGDIEDASRYYKSGDTSYLRLEATNGAATCTITATPVVPKKAPAKDVTISKGSEMWFEYTASANANYKVELTGTGATACTIAMLKAINGGSHSKSPVHEIALKAGETVYYKVTNTNEAEAKTVSLNIAPVEIKGLTIGGAGETATLKVDGIGVWYSFKAPKADRYSFAAIAKATTEGQTATASIEYYRDAEGSNRIPNVTSNPESAILIRAGETIYINVSVDDADATVTTTVKAITIKQLPTTKDGITETNLAQDTWTWYKIEGEGVYDLAISDKTENGYYTVRCAKNSESFHYSLPTKPVILGKSDVYTIAIKANTDKLGYKLTAVKRTIDELTRNTPLEKSLKAGENLYVSFKAPEKGHYALLIKDLKDSVKATVSPDGVSWNLDNGNYHSFVSNINDKAIFTINVNSEESVSFKVEVVEVEPSDITEAGTATVKVADTPVGYIKWYSYTAAETGKYIIKASDENAQIHYASELYGDFKRKSFSGVEEETFEEGDTWYFALYYNAKPEKDVTFNITKAEAKELKTEYLVDVSKLVADEKIYLSFTAPADNRYVFACDNASIPNGIIYNDVNDTGANGGLLKFNEDKPMKAGEELIFAVSATVPKENFKVSVSPIEIKTLDTAKEEKKDLAENEALWLSFTAGETAKYAFNTTNVEETRIYKELTAEDYSSQSGISWTYGADNGQTLYLELIPDKSKADASSNKTSVSIKVEADTKMTKLSETANEVKDITANGEKWAYFTAETAGFYTFMAYGDDCNVYVRTDVNGSSNIVYTGEEYTKALGKGDSLYFEIQNTTSNVTTEKITITKTGYIIELTPDAVKDVFPDKEGCAYYVLTAPEKGEYSVTADDSDIYYGDTPESYEFGAKNLYVFSLDKGEVKYIRISLRNSSQGKVSCTKVEGKTVTTEKPLTLKLNKGGSVSVKWTAESDGYYMIQYSADMLVSYQYEEDSNSSYINSWPRLVKSGDEKELVITALNNNTTVTVSVEKLDVIKINGVVSSVPIDLNRGETKLVEWTSSQNGQYAFEVEYDKYTQCRYYSSSLQDVQEDSDTWWSNYVATNGKIYVLIIGWNDEANVRFTATKETPKLPPYSELSLTLSEGESETIKFTAPSSGYYLFCTDNRNAEGTLTTGYSTRSYGTYSGDFAIKQYLSTKQTATLTVKNAGSNTGDFTVNAYKLYNDYVTDVYNLPYEPGMFYLPNRQEAWFKFTASESGNYEFAVGDSSAQMRLYAGDDTDGEELGRKTPDSKSSIVQWIDSGDTVLLRTWMGYNHSAGSYSVSVKSAPVELTSVVSNVSIEGNTTYATQTMEDQQQHVINWTYAGNAAYNPSNVTLSFEPKYNDNNINMELYLGDSENYVRASSNGSTLEYEVDSEHYNKIKLVAWQNEYRAFNGSVKCTEKKTGYTEVSMDDHHKQIHVPTNGSSLVTYNPVETAGNYVIYCGTEQVDITHVTIYVNDEKVIPDNEFDSNSQFQYMLELKNGDIVKIEISNDSQKSQIDLYSYKVESSSENNVSLPVDNDDGNPLSITAEAHTIKTVTYTAKAGKYTFTPSTESENCKFALTIGDDTYTEWGEEIKDVELSEDGTITFTLFNPANNDSVSASLSVTYTAPEEGGEESGGDTPDEGDNNGGDDNSGGGESSGGGTDDSGSESN